MDETSSGSWPIAGFGISCAEPLGSATREFSKMDIKKISCDNGSMTELVQDNIQWYALVLYFATGYS